MKLELLSDIEIRVIGSLIEKEITTPEYYPLSLNALTNACNQKSSREPVVTYTENEVEAALSSLREKKLARMVEDGGRVVKFKEALIENLQLEAKQTALMTLLMLRGPQTPGELRSRSGRLYEFKSLDEVEKTLQELSNAEPNPMVIKLDRQTGMKEKRYAHLLSGLPVQEQRKSSADEEDQITQLSKEIEKLKSEVEILKEQFSDFKKQFE